MGSRFDFKKPFNYLICHISIKMSLLLYRSMVDADGSALPSITHTPMVHMHSHALNSFDWAAFQIASASLCISIVYTTYLCATRKHPRLVRAQAIYTRIYTSRPIFPAKCARTRRKSKRASEHPWKLYGNASNQPCQKWNIKIKYQEREV